MKVLFFTEHLAAGGKERQIIELLKGLKSHNNIQMELVLTKDEIHYQEIVNLNIPIHIIKRRFVKKDPRLFFLFFAIVKRFKPDIIHVFGHMPAVYAVPSKILLRIPLINNEIQDTSPAYRLIAKDLIFRTSDRIIGNSHSGLRAYRPPMFKSAVIYNGFSFDRLRNMEAPEKIRLRFGIGTPYVIGMVASFNKYKDYETYIRAAISIQGKRSDITFLCIGNGDDSKYRQMTVDARVQNILFLGKQTLVESIMNICDIGVLTTFGEGISNALMEFMALAKPVVATDLGGTIELIENNVTGFLVTVSNPDQLMERIMYLVENEGERHRIGQQACEKIKSDFSYDRMVNNFISEYVNLLKK